MGRLMVVHASVERKGVRGERKAVSHKLLAASREGRGLGIVSVRVCIGVHNEVISGALFGVFYFQQRGEDAAIRRDGFKKGVRASLAVAAEHQVTESGEGTSFLRREEALGDGDGEFGEDSTDFVGGDHGAARGDEFAGEIGGTKAAVRRVGVRVAEAVALRVGGEGASASIGEAKLAAVVMR